jgi:Protein of unknown function (DUF3604)
MIRALRDADGANLDRIQIVKGWLAKDGKTQEAVTCGWAYTSGFQKTVSTWRRRWAPTSLMRSSSGYP